MLAILRAGGVYLPVDPAYPRSRIAFMLRDSQARVVITQDSLRDVVPEVDAKLCLVDRDWPSIQSCLADNPVNRVAPLNLAYVIYTSGSTGTPKGVAVPHKGVVSLLGSMVSDPGITKHDILLALTSPSFDIAAVEIYLPLSVGARLVLAERGHSPDATL